MELPDDVLRLVREYSRPCFQHFREYNRLAAICGPIPLFKEKLQTSSYLARFLEYETALMEWRSSKRSSIVVFRRLMYARDAMYAP